jgi:hypothetical protein
MNEKLRELMQTGMSPERGLGMVAGVLNAGGTSREAVGLVDLIAKQYSESDRRELLVKAAKSQSADDRAAYDLSKTGPGEERLRYLQQHPEAAGDVKLTNMLRLHGGRGFTEAEQQLVAAQRNDLRLSVRSMPGAAEALESAKAEREDEDLTFEGEEEGKLVNRADRAFKRQRKRQGVIGRAVGTATRAFTENVVAPVANLFLDHEVSPAEQHARATYAATRMSPGNAGSDRALHELDNAIRENTRAHRETGRQLGASAAQGAARAAQQVNGTEP